ncbi:MAG TPA: hypothetical protein VF017_03080 [Thermoanaerobaculia bacterium]|nr:hypothetical protein [Thermoanaerobaculia bacterium]
MYGRAMWAVSCLASLGFVATAVMGMRGGGFETGHLFAALASTLVLAFTQVWGILYLRLAGREVRGDGTGSVWTDVALPLAVIASALASFGLGGAAFGHSPLGAWHGAAFWVSLGLQALALALSRRRLRALDRALAQAVGQGA